VADANRDLVVGVKLRAGWQMVGDDPRPAVRLARRAADLLDLPLMVHVIDMRMELPELLPSLRSGDVITHCFHGNEGGVLDADGRVWPAVRAAVEAGVVLDVGHGIGSFAFRVARAALEQDLRPTTISSDIHAHNRDGPVYDLPRTMSKLLHLGLPLADVVTASTSAPAAAVAHVVAGLGTLAPGGSADLTLLELERGSFPLTDGEGVTEHARERLVARRVLRAGRVVECDPPRG
jgi:dihydroorotase